MAFIKYISPTDFQNLSDTPAKLVKRSRNKISGSDLQELQKRAALFDYEKFLDSLNPGEIPVHVIALGCDEVYGPNRNGDAFTKEACRKYHKTFVKYGHWFREHDHHDPSKSYGIVKDAIFNEKLGRIELLVALNGTKEAAKRNKGLVAEKELELLESESDLPVSMACFVDPKFPVLTPTGYKAISSIGVGDELINSKGRAARVAEVVTYSYTGRLYTIHLKNIDNPLIVTESHPFIALPKGADISAAPKWVLASDIKAGFRLACLYNINFPEKELLYDPAELAKDLINRLVEGDLTEPNFISILYYVAGTNKPALLNIFKQVFQAYSKLSFYLKDLNSAYNLFTLLCCLNLRPRLKRLEEGYKISLPKRKFKEIDSCLNSIQWDQLYFRAVYPDVEVVKVEEEWASGIPVWNFEVEDEHTYISGGIVSHNCKVAYDVCSGCGKKSRNRREYCTEKTCKYGGLSKNIGKTYEDGHILRAFNPEPSFFDISLVEVPADRIAYALGVIGDVRSTKSGSFPWWLYKFPSDEEIIDQIKLLGELAACERAVLPNTKIAGFYSNAPVLSKAFYERVSYLDIPNATYLLSKNDIILPVENFLSQFGGYTDEEAVKVGSTVRKVLPRVFNLLLEDEDILKKLANNIFYPRPPDYEEDVKNILGPGTPYIKIERVSAHTTKHASYDEADPRILEVAKVYGLYQLASISGASNELRKLAVKSIIRINKL